MYFEEQPYDVYVKTNSEGYITEVSSSAFLADTAQWTHIDSGVGDRYLHAQKNYFPESIAAENGAHRYRLVDGNVMLCTAEEMAAQQKEDGPVQISLEERVKLLETGAVEMKKMMALYWGKMGQE